jgi:hypothetical protein
MIPGGKSVSPLSVWRWSHDGLKTPTGARVKLATYRCGKTTCTTEADLVKFFAAAGGQVPTTVMAD